MPQKRQTGAIIKKILVVFTGGTIGSKAANKVIDVNEQQSCVLIEKFRETSQLDVDFITMQPLNILSENCTPKDWSRLITALKNVNAKELDGIIITHGSDTLPYTAAMISYVFADTEIPIIFTASNYGLDYPKSNGVRNFISSVEFIYHSGIPGIFVIFENSDNEMKIYLGSRIVEANPVNDQFSGFGNIDFGKIQEGRLIRKEDSFTPLFTRSGAHRESLGINNINFNNSILAIRPYPGLDYSLLKFSGSKPHAVIHGLYHSATACIAEGDVSLPKYVKYCREEGIDFYMASFKNMEEDLYISSQELLGNDAIPLQNISMEAAIAKLWLAYNLELQNPKELVIKNIYYEFLR